MAVLLGHQGVRFGGYQTVRFLGCLAIGAESGRIGLDLLLDARHADFEELVHVARDDAQEAQAFEQRHPLILRLGEDATIEGEKAKFPVQIVLRWKTRLDALTAHEMSPLFLEV